MSFTDEHELVPRFSFWARFQHAAVIFLFGVLLVTGMPQKWPALEASRWVIDLVGGVQVARWLHRTAGLVFAGFVIAHFAVVVASVMSRRVQPSLLLTAKDFRDAIQHLRYHMGRTEEAPRFGRWDYRQKFEYWGLVFGATIMVVSGLLLRYPITVSRLLPAELIPAAKVMHSNEALLAFLIILVWHMYSTHLSPESFPMDTSIFTGKIRKSKLKASHPLEYEERFGSR